MLGLAVALFSIAKVLAAPSVGRWTSHIGVRLSLICCMLLLLLGNALYLCAQSVVWVLVSRVVLGLASCSSTPCRTWVASSGSTSHDRAKLTAVLSSATTLGFISGPFIGGLLFLPGNDFISLRGPGCVGALLSIANLLALCAVDLEQRQENNPEMARALTSEAPSRAASPPAMRWVPHDNGRVVLWALALVQLFVTLPLASFEALVTPYAGAAFELDGVRIGLLFAGASGCTLLVTFATPWMLVHLSARGLLLVASAIMSTACIALVADAVVSFFVMQFVFFGAYAASQSALFCVFNERFRRHPRIGEYIGWISAAGSVGRCAGPLWAVALYRSNIVGGATPAAAAEAIWLLSGGGVLIGMLAVLAVWRELVPLNNVAEAGVPSHASIQATVRAVRTAIATCVVVFCYVLASTFDSPQVLQANRPPFNYTAPTHNSHGYCFQPPCDPFFGTFKPPWWVNPTNVQGTSPNERRVAAFYGYLCVLLISSAALQAFPTCEAKLTQRIRVWGSSVHSCATELAVLLLTLGLISFWIVDALGLGSLKRENTQDRVSHYGAAAGHVLNLMLSLVLLPVGKSSSLSAVFGLSWDRALVYHRLLGSIALCCVLLHVVLEMVKWAMQGDFWRFVFGFAYYNAGSDVWAWNIPIMECLALCVAVAAVMSLAVVRRHSYRAFYTVHLVLPLLVLMSFVHSWDFWKFVLVSAILYAVDKVEWHSELACGATESPRLRSLKPLGHEVVALCLETNGSAYPYSPGQVVYLNLPSLSRMDWHPFTIANTEGRCAATSEGSMKFHIKASSKPRWTRALHTLACSSRHGVHDIEADARQTVHGHPSSDSPLRVRVIGPFGGIAHLESTAAPIQILVAGGVGITPISALAALLLSKHDPNEVPRGNFASSGIRPTRHLQLIWCARNMELFVEYAALIEQLIATPHTSVRLYLTSHGAETAASGMALPACVRDHLHMGRPDVGGLFTQLEEVHAPGQVERGDARMANRPPARSLVSVFCCGPSKLEADVRAACNQTRSADVTFRSLNFEL